MQLTKKVPVSGMGPQQQNAQLATLVGNIQYPIISVRRETIAGVDNWVITYNG